MEAGRRKRGIRRAGTLLLGLAVTAGILIPSAGTSLAAGADIRVALYADLGSKYKSTTPFVTLQSAQGWNLAEAGGGAALLPVAATAKVRISLDTYRVKVLETASWSEAAAAAKILQGTSDKPQLFRSAKNGGTVYQLYTGPYASEAAAKDGASRVAASGISLPGGQTPAVRGGKHLSAGSYPTLAEADAARLTLAASGLDAWTAAVPGDGAARYEVWVGEAANEADLAAAKTLLQQAFAQLPLVNSGSGILVRTDSGGDWSSEVQLPHYQISGSGAAFAAAGNEAGIQLAERSKRTYRGDIELSSMNGSLAVVNEVPLEQYLYAVVGGEVSASWPEEALKAQAVAARSYALAQGNRFDIANVVDTTLSQVYNGIGAESASIIKAVDATAGEVLMSGGKVVETVFSSNAGGVTADPSEVWGSGSGSVFASVDSSGDAAASATAKKWYYVLLPSGASGYVREDNVKLTGTKTAGGLAKLTATVNDVNVRPLPVVQSGVSPVGKMNAGETAVVLNQTLESGSYSWIKGPYTSAEILKSLSGKTGSTLPSSITNLQVTGRGPSGRVVQLKANGTVVEVKYPDLFRSALGGLPSTRFDIVPAASYTVLGADGKTVTAGSSPAQGVLSASGLTTGGGNGTVILNGGGEARVVEKSPGFYFIGWGNGHGLGMSQWGVKGMADEGRTYRDILQHYFHNVTIVKE
ncbi:SpoIID/LytB domain-containing protein [Paenibacillus glufosinatiresistens]|uniref:SpoIID/LytB domain-containing protein n=1 Tax=Paenibacillus glufosinatiresistens TaxID=3070657 RepID=UPI00286E5C7A|nr:SpoIID/LytB domain-containing protein [Paenibacillus sp. YX.27]